MTPYLGEIRIFAGNYAPQNWMMCDGTVLKISDYQVLFSLLGNAWGGDGMNNFGLPDLRGHLPVGQGAAPGLTSRTLGQSGGADTVQLTGANLPAHSHAVYASTSPGTSLRPDNTMVFATAQDQDVFYTTDTSSISNMNASAVSDSGRGQPHTNQMPTQSVSYIICINGIYPVRG